MYKILLVEDDIIISENIQKHLKKWNYNVKLIQNFNDIINEFISFMPQLILLDITLPYMNGFYWCSEIRRISTIPIIFISSADENINTVMAINMGGDDFISKPFDFDVLTAKISALIRRTYSFVPNTNIIIHNNITLNLGDASLIYNKKNIELTKNELKILQVLLENAGNIISRDNLMLKLWNSDSFIDDNTLTVNIARLRKKLDDIGLNNFIKTKKNLGYLVD